eukprot:TRINITY_DN11272_c0_g1_i4.p1 TRINITY_DN11272_c0_g1~~TRINITY_DN11272_c0_g1_i4.p1  ORF type:complete len:201 (+),score=4.98 TRINITY_DN11272_c0_g1_i4:47-604(+)
MCIRDRNLLRQVLTHNPLGSSPNDDVILEFATAITDASLSKIIKGPKDVLQLTEDKHKLHTIPKDLLNEIHSSTLTIKEAEETVLKFLGEVAKGIKVQLAGKDCSRARALMRKWMPALNEALDYHNLDVRSVATCVEMWKHQKFALVRQERAEEEVASGIELLRQIKGQLFKCLMDSSKFKPCAA